MYGASAGNGLGNSEASIGGATAGIGPVNSWPRFFNPYPVDKYATW